MEIIQNLIDKTKTSIEIFNSTKSLSEKINLLNCIIYNLLPSKFKTKYVNFLPISATIYINTICNYRCSFCFLINEDHKGDKNMNLDMKGFDKIINNNFLKYASRITLGGGEPYLNKNIFDFIKILKSKKKIISIYTNGSLIEKNYDQILKNQPNYLNISHYDEKFEDLKFILKKFNNQKDCITRLSKIIQANKLDDIEKSIFDAIECDFDRVIFQNYFPYKDNEAELVLFENNNTLKKIKKKIKRYEKKIKIIWPNVLNSKEGFNCNNISVNTTIDSKGNLALCCFLTPPRESNGNIFNHSSNPWNSLEFIRFRSHYAKKSPSECSNCYFKNGIKNRVF